MFAIAAVGRSSTTARPGPHSTSRKPSIPPSPPLRNIASSSSRSPLGISTPATYPAGSRGLAAPALNLIDSRSWARFRGKMGFEQMLRDAALRVTRPRLAVLSAVHAHPHADTDSIIGFVRQDIGVVSHQAV